MRTLTPTLLTLAVSIGFASSALAQSNVSEDHKFAWGENIGWTNWRDADGADQGVVSTDLNLPIVPEGDPFAFLSGFIWAENAGWINIGDGAGPYEALGGFGNESDLHFGVNVLTNGDLEGLAWGENLGWINFGTAPSLGADGARYDGATNRLRGYAWGENVGWINLDDMNQFVSFEMCPGDLNGSGSVDGADLAALLAVWGTDNAAADLNGDGIVNGADLASMLANWGSCS